MTAFEAPAVRHILALVAFIAFCNPALADGFKAFGYSQGMSIADAKLKGKEQGHVFEPQFGGTDADYVYRIQTNSTVLPTNITAVFCGYKLVSVAYWANGNQDEFMAYLMGHQSDLIFFNPTKGERGGRHDTTAEFRHKNSDFTTRLTFVTQIGGEPPSAIIWHFTSADFTDFEDAFDCGREHD